MCNCVVFEIKLGTVDQVDVDVEWRLRPYLNTAKKRLALSDEVLVFDYRYYFYSVFFAFYSNGSEFATNTRQNYI